MLRRLARRLREESGMSLAEVLMVSFMFVVVLTAALAPFETLLKIDRRTHAQNDTQRNARSTSSAIVFNLRNLAGQSQLVERADPYDLVFETVDREAKPAGSQNARNVMRVRYCLNTTAPAASPAAGQLWEQTLRWTTASVPSAMPSTASCPDIFWTGAERHILTQGVTNRINGSSRPIFLYFPVGATLTQITSIRFDSYTDQDPADAVKESRMTTGVLLRNQNGAPTASVVTTPGTTRQVRLDATASDPESLPLTYRWCDLTANSTCDDITRIGTGQTYTHTFASGVATGSTRNMRLVVTDAGGFEAIVNFTVVVPA
jgi:hypothetical protein